MKALISKVEMNGVAAAPSSKSYTIRSLMCASLAGGLSRILNPLISDDTEAAADVLEQVGTDITKEESCWLVRGGRLHEPGDYLFCRDSAATFRFMIAISSVIPGKCHLVPGSSLALRPIEPLLNALSQLGVKNQFENKTVIVNGNRLLGGTVNLPGDISSQFISALLLVAPLSDKGMTIQLTTPPTSRPYLKMTLECMRRFEIVVEAPSDFMFFNISKQDYRPTEYFVESDWSSASYLLGVGALSGQVEVTNLNSQSFQGDRIVINLLQAMGGEVMVNENSVKVRKVGLKAIRADLTDCIDLLPTLAMLAAVANGESCFYGINRARLKESNRVLALKEGLARMGIPVAEEKDKLIITGGNPTGAVINSYNDHRIAMAFSILGAAVGNTIIEGAECVSKTYPHFWQTFKQLGGKVKLNVE
ncbi:MAG: 3-phosphoshikimate 1-carboxyvinyltransferase [Dehalococcoidia bacterium]|nr:MAG: 3-phosphoshikimate 1-carboxyvinyltransferase [Dehalococcoidia bacterium]